jgi:hypothetical protein
MNRRRFVGIGVTDMRRDNPPAQGVLRLPVVSAGAEHLVRGYLMRRNILTYEAPPNNQGYDLICIHPDPRHRPGKKELALVRVQVKSRYATDRDRGFPVKEASLDAFDFLIIAFLNIGNFFRGRDGAKGSEEPEFYTFPKRFIRKHHRKGRVFQRVLLGPLRDEIGKYKNDLGFELIAEALGIKSPRRMRDMEAECG